MFHTRGARTRQISFGVETGAFNTTMGMSTTGTASVPTAQQNVLLSTRFIDVGGRYV